MDNIKYYFNTSGYTLGPAPATGGIQQRVNPSLNYRQIISLANILEILELAEQDVDGIREIRAALEVFYNEWLDRESRYEIQYFLAPGKGHLTGGSTARSEELESRLQKLPHIPDRFKTINTDKRDVGQCLLLAYDSEKGSFLRLV